jgi:hypothetical protein
MSTTDTQRLKGVRAKLVELWTRLIPFSTSEGIYHNGADNQYPYQVERVVANSPTAKRASKMFSKYLQGAGLVADSVNDEAEIELLSKVHTSVCNTVAVQYGAFLHVSYKIEGDEVKPHKIANLDYTRCRIAKQDDDENAGKIIYNDYEEKAERKDGKFKRNTTSKTRNKTNEKWYYPFSRNQKVILTQILNDGRLALKERGQKDWETADISLEEAINHYRGQVFYLNFTPNFTYAEPLIESVYNDADTEYRMSLYANTMTREGFLGKVAVVTSGLDPDEAKQIEKDIHNWLGAENSGSVYHLDVASPVENLSEIIHIEQLESQYDDTMFVNLEKRVKRNLLGAYNNLPEALAFSNEGGMFEGGEKILEMKLFYWEQTASEREEIVKTFEMLGFPIQVKPLVNLSKEVKTNED